MKGMRKLVGCETRMEPRMAPARARMPAPASMPRQQEV